MALQTCKRCRKRRIKCDLNLAGCKNCRLADVECLFFDVSLRQEIPRSYCYSLQKKAEELETEIQSLRSKATVGHSQELRPIALPGMHDYHLDAKKLRLDPNHTKTVYVGPGSSAALMENLFKGMLKWHLTHKGPEFDASIQSLMSPAPTDDLSAVTIPILFDHKKMDHGLMIAPSTQRALVKHFHRLIQQEYPLLSPEQEKKFLELENPFRWCAANSSHPDYMPLIAVLAISSAIFTRDLDPKFSSISIACRQSLGNVSLSAHAMTNIQNLHMHIKKECFLIIYEMVAPSSDVTIWTLIGQAIACLTELRNKYQTKKTDLDSEYLRLEFCLLKLEGSLALHFRRPSRYCEIWPESNAAQLAARKQGLEMQPLYNFIRHIVKDLCTVPLPSQEHFESLIPSSYQISARLVGIVVPLASAELYISLHPLFTSLGSDLFSDYPLPQNAMKLLHVVGSSASSIIDGFVKRGKDSRIISIWMAAERVLEAGAVWASYLIIMRRKQSSTGGLTSIGMKAVMRTLTSCSNLLASFAERWKSGAVYVELWESFLSLLWAVLE